MKESHIAQWILIFGIPCFVKELDTEKVAAVSDQGALTLRIPRLAHAQPRWAEIRVE